MRILGMFIMIVVLLVFAYMIDMVLSVHNAVDTAVAAVLDIPITSVLRVDYIRYALVIALWGTGLIIVIKIATSLRGEAE